jgi:hypothetical protein
MLQYYKQQWGIKMKTILLIILSISVLSCSKYPRGTFDGYKMTDRQKIKYKMDRIRNRYYR